MMIHISHSHIALLIKNSTVNKKECILVPEFHKITISTKGVAAIREKSRISLSIKQLEEDPLLETLDKVIPKVSKVSKFFFCYLLIYIIVGLLGNKMVQLVPILQVKMRAMILSLFRGLKQ